MICDRCGGDSGPCRAHPDPMVCVAILTTRCEAAEAQNKHLRAIGCDRVKVLWSEELLRDADLRRGDGARLTVELGEPDEFGFYSPIITVHHEDNLQRVAESDRDRLQIERGWLEGARDQMRDERDQLKVELNRAVYQLDKAKQDRDSAEAERDRLEAENKRLTVKCNNSLANNLCPDHRDKQAGKPCLACTIDRLEAELAEARERIADDNAVCLCGCPASEHERQDDGCESCGNDAHGCIRVCTGVLAEAQGERNRMKAELAEFKAWHDKRVNWYDAELKAEREAHARTREQLAIMTQAVGLATTIKSDMPIRVDDPIGMMQEVASYVEGLRGTPAHQPSCPQCDRAKAIISEAESAMPRYADPALGLAGNVKAMAERIEVLGRAEGILRQLAKQGDIWVTKEDVANSRLQLVYSKEAQAKRERAEGILRELRAWLEVWREFPPFISVPSMLAKLDELEATHAAERR